MSRTRAVLTAVVLLSALAFVGCNDDDPEPKFDPTPSSEAPTSPSTSPTVAALEPEETVRAWVKAQNLAMDSGESNEVRALSAEDCKSCSGLIDPIDAVFSAGGHFETDGWRIDKVRKTSASRKRSTVTAAVTIAGGRTFNSATSDPVAYDEERSIVQFKLEQEEDGWRVAFVGFLS